jgi:hypothetical protein
MQLQGGVILLCPQTEFFTISFIVFTHHTILERQVPPLASVTVVVGNQREGRARQIGAGMIK